MPALYLDLETIPDQRPDARERIAENIQPPGNMTKEQTIALWRKEKMPEAIEKKYRDTALDGTYGEILMLGYAIGNEKSNVRWRSGLKPEDEKAILRDFWKHLSGVMVDTWVGHNIHEFDMRFLYQRSVVHGISSTCYFPYNGTPWGGGIFDTMFEWAGRGNRVSLAELCRTLGIPYDTTIDGSMVWDIVQAGKYMDLVRYCGEDVEAVREIHKKLTFGVV